MGCTSKTPRPYEFYFERFIVAFNIELRSPSSFRNITELPAVRNSPALPYAPCCYSNELMSIVVLWFYNSVRVEAVSYSHKPPVKTLQRGQPFHKGQSKSTFVLYTLYKITSKRGQPLYKGQKAGSQVWPYLEVPL